MSYTRGVIAILIAFMLLSGGLTFSQRRRPPEDQIKLGQMFFAQETKCRNLLRGESWKEAEAACKVATQLADRFADHRELEKMGAYQSVGHSLIGQGRYQEALKYYSRALEVSRPRLNDTNAEVGGLYMNMALAYHNLRDLDKAREFYRKAEGTYQTAYSGINEEEVTEEGVEMKRGYLKTLKKIYEYHLLAAEQASAFLEVEEIKKRIERLPR